MAKKNKKNSKINQKIRKYFDDDPFDVGVERVETQTLSELFATLGIYDIEPNKALMVKTLRMIWSEADSSMRQEILRFFEADGRVYKSPKPKDEPLFNRDEKIDAILAELDVTAEEALRLREAFATVRAKKITIEKMESRLRYIRFEIKKEKLERELEGFFDFDEHFEFNASIRYALLESSFHKIETLRTKTSYSYEYIEERSFEEIVERIAQDKLEALQHRQKSVETFLASLKIPHAYLTTKEILDSLRASPPKSKLSYPLISAKVLKRIVTQKIEAKEVALHEEEILIVVQEQLLLPKSTLSLPYNLELHVELEGLLEEIWEAKRFNFDALKQELKAEYEKVFLEHLQSIVSTCAGYAELLHLSDEELHSRVYMYVTELVPATLHISAKTERKILRRFLHSIQGELIKKQRQELLARTIRDFKSLFPIARSMRRKLTLHIGPTNSGKTYTAMQRLKQADTGYYLAPLRLLALEGYESLKKEGIESSLITGEEQILDEEATHISSTIEMMNYDVDVDVAVIDEVQMIDDRDRGWAWANAIIGAPAKEVIMTGSPNVKDAVIALAEYLGEELEIIEFERKNPLELLPEPTDIKQIEPATAVIAFSRKEVLRLKQQLSREFAVSVVYGNLSPEVRKEEARRFREGETQILVATDAIAMGMNLPIKTVLFSKAQKFDGVKERNLYASEIQQIAGRAGRYGLHEAGYVGALNKEALAVLQKNFSKEAKRVKTPFRVMASLEHIKLVGTILEESSLEEILRFFIKNMEFNGPFYAASLDDMLEASKIVDRYDLDIASKYHLACAPLTLKSTYIIEAFESYVYALEQKKPVYYHPPKLSGEHARTSHELLLAEDMVKEISLYLWLSYRFGEYFVDEQKAREYRGVLNRYIENTLQKTELTQACKLCTQPLAPNSKYAICQKCFKKHYTHKSRARRH
jgi:ATP-dependent RNA helicase SUPV3L1/SUV3